MLDYAAFLLLVLVLTAALFASWRALGERRGLRVSRLAGGLACLTLALLVAGVASFRFSKARTLQLFGDIVPRVETEDSIVALTFDDGPASAPTEKVLAVLASHGVRATFYLNGQGIEEHFSAAQRIVQAGHEVGNHTYTHPVMLGLSQERIRTEIERTDAQIRRAGFTGEIHFRSPYGKKYVALPYYLARTNRKNIFFDVEPESFPEVAGEAERITEHVLERARPGSIILLHVMSRARAESLEAVPRIIEGLHQKGYRFVTVSELLRRGRT
jgi:peptidoglycan/xylan/chitin deacetylase (PgdA/CDA1 family)